MRTIIAAAIFSLTFVAFCPPVAAQTSQPTFLYLMEGKGTPGGTIHVFGLNSSTGAITEVPGSPFSAGLSPLQLVVDPTGRYVYVVNYASEDITAFSVSPSTGALTELPGSPFSIGGQPVTTAVDPTGRFLYVVADSVSNNTLQEFLYEYTIDNGSGILTAAENSPEQGIFATSITFSPAGNYAYLTQGSPVPGNNDPVVVCSVDFSSGTMTTVGSVQPLSRGASEATESPAGSFLYSIDSEDNMLDAFAVGSLGGSASELSGSPIQVPNNPYSLAVHPSGNFVYVVSENQPYQSNYTPNQYAGSISAFTIAPGTGALKQLPASPFADGINPTSIVLDPTGSFAYTTSTLYVSNVILARILGFSINASSGALTPLSWSPWTDTAISVGAQLAISPGPVTSSNPTPMISSLSPPFTVATAVPFTLQVNGADFVPGATVYFGGKPRNTTFVSSTQLNASILASDIDNDGTVVIFVFNPLPGGGASTSVEFQLLALSPILSSLSPSSVNVGVNGSGLTVLGSNFVTSSVVNFNGTPLSTGYDSPTTLSATIPAADLMSPGTAGISVTTPSNGVGSGGTSSTVTLLILPPETQPVLASISPASAAGGGPAFTLTVNGSGFVQISQVSFNGNNVPTTFISSTQLTALIPASAIAVAGYPNVAVTNPGGLVTFALPFTVVNPAPGGGSVSPPSLPAGGNALTLTVTGTGFTQGSVVLVNGNARVTTFVSSTLLQATLLGSDLSQPGTLIITVVTPPPGGGTTSPISVPVTNPVPQESSLLPSSTVVGNAAITLNVSGANFNMSSSVSISSTVLSNVLVLKTVYMSPALLQTTIPASAMSQAGTLSVLVTNSPPGGGSTSALTFIVDDYTVTAPTSSTTVSAGQPAVFTLMLATFPSNGTYPNPITFTATGLPAAASASFSPSSPVTLGTTPQAVTLSISTTPHAETSSNYPPRGSHPVLPPLWLVGMAFALTGFWLWASRGRMRPLTPQILLALLMLVAAGMVACGAVGAGPSSPPPVNSTTGTPEGTYQIAVTANSSGVTHSTTVTLTVM